MPSTHDLRRALNISSTAQITKAMQMVAASKMRKAQDAALTTRPFAQLLYRIQRRQLTGDLTHRCWRRAKFGTGRDPGRHGQGPVRRAEHQRVSPGAPVRSRDDRLIAAGRAAQFIARTGRQLAAEFTFTATRRVSPRRARLPTFARDLFLKGEVDQVQIVATRFINTMTQEPVVAELSRIGEIKGLGFRRRTRRELPPIRLMSF